MANPIPVSRREMLTYAGAAAVGLSMGTEVSRAAEIPRLPLKILNRAKLTDDAIKRIAAVSPKITVNRDVPAAEANVIFGNISAEEAASKNLCWTQCQSAGVEHYPLDEMIKSDVILTNAQGCYAPEIAEHAFGLLFTLTRGIAQQIKQMPSKKWGSENTPIEMRGMTMGIIGLGGIGREVARRAKAMDMKVLAVDAEPMLAERFAMVDEVSLVDTGLDAMLKRCDVVVSCAPSTPKSRGMLGAPQFDAMKRGSYFINVSRGKIVKTDALIAALKSGQLAGAGLDVTEPEPLPADHALWDAPNVVLTSHIAGQSPMSWPRVEHVFTENVARYAQGLPLLNVVDKSKGY